MTPARRPCAGVPRLPGRRAFLADVGMGFTGVVLGALLWEDGVARGLPAESPGSPPPPRPTAKSVIWLFMLGGVSHVESFDPKPALNRYAGKTIAETPFAHVLKSPDVGRNFRPFAGGPKLHTRILPLQVGFRKRGACGLELSDWWPHLGDCADDLAVIRSLWTTDFQHSAQLQFHTGRTILDPREPSLGAWVHYGLGSLNRDLPQFVVIGRPPSDFGGGPASHQASYLGPEHDGVQVDVDPDGAVPFPPRGPSQYRESQEAELRLVRRLNELAAVDYPSDPALRARIKSYEVAFRMQTTFPDIGGLKGETRDTEKLYGLDDPVTRPFGRQCLVARRLVERGIRFVQVYHGGSPDDDNGLWDSHTELRKNHSRRCREVDRPISGLLKDLKRRGLLGSTLVVFVTEFGRSPNVEYSSPTGRDHHIYGFSAWLAGGGVKGGVAHGATDELGFHAVEKRHYVTDVHATVLHLLGLDPRRLEVPGRKRLDIERGRPILDILA
jgi:hypothetical protein